MFIPKGLLYLIHFNTVLLITLQLLVGYNCPVPSWKQTILHHPKFSIKKRMFLCAQRKRAQLLHFTRQAPLLHSAVKNGNDCKLFFLIGSTIKTNHTTFNFSKPIFLSLQYTGNKSCVLLIHGLWFLHKRPCMHVKTGPCRILTETVYINLPDVQEDRNAISLPFKARYYLTA